MVISRLNPDLVVAAGNGAFAYVRATGEWFDITGEFAPKGNYQDIDFIEERNLLRWSAWGRGAWNLQLK